MRSHTSNSHQQQQENNFLGLQRQSKADRAKEILFKTVKITIVIVVLVAGTIFGLSKLQKDKPQATTPHHDANITQEPSDSNQKIEDGSKSADTSNPAEYSSSSSTTTRGQQQTHNTTTTSNTATVNNTATQPDNYNPSKCQSYLDTSNSLKSIADTKYSELQNMTNSRLDYGTIYENSGRNAAIADQAYKLQEAQLNAKQQEWQDSLSARNKAYEKYQSCMASL